MDSLVVKDSSTVSKSSKILIEEWIASMRDLSYSSFSTCSYEIDPLVEPSDKINNDWNRQIANVYGNINGVGGFVCQNSADYFEGEFFGSVHDRYGHFTKISEDGRFTVGKWINGLMEGVVDFEQAQGWRRAVYRRGLKHGLDRSFNGSYGNAQDLHRVAFYCNDSISGIVWECLAGGALMVGRVDPETELFSTKDVLYIYPDLQTAIIGRYDNGNLISGFMCTLANAWIDAETFMLNVSICSDTYGPRIKCDISTNSVISRFPLCPDLWESQLVEVKNSSIENSGQGLYLKMDVSAGQIVALFNGIRFSSSRNNANDKSPNQNYDYRIRLNGDTDIDIPPNSTALHQYCATLGHKANHSFTPNAKWARLQHPRFGLIIAIKTLKDLPKGSEVLVNYGMGMADAPLWYKTLWVKHLREEKHLTDEEIKYWCTRQYAMNGRSIDLPLQ